MYTERTGKTGRRGKMFNYIDQVKDHELFQGISREELSAVFGCLGCYTKKYKKDQIVILPEDTVQCVGFILKGSIHMLKENVDGEVVLIAPLKVGELFGETFACGNTRASILTFQAASESEVLYLPFYKVLHVCGSACVFHHRLMENMVRLICEKNMRLMEKIEVVSRKTLRDKILSYLYIQSEKQGKREFEVPLGRVEMAEYLCADRSAMTRELSRMKEEGIIDYDKNRFVLR